MGKDFRVKDGLGNYQPFSCGNSRFKTDINKGFPHAPSKTKGSVFKTPLVRNGHSLWLEHVEEIGGGSDLYWLMWYDSSGNPTVSMSSIFNRAQLSEMIKGLANFVP
ncbi:MAG: hypothetical protein AB1403_14585 [Candidatus Riflebacteria bacterium]